MSIREKWNAEADEYNQFDALDSVEIEQFADKVIEGLEGQLEALKKDARSKIENLENQLGAVIDELNLSDAIIEKHGPLGTPPAELVRLVLLEKDRKTQMLKQGFVDITDKTKVLCNKDGCTGVLEKTYLGDCCSCHIASPCAYCMSAYYFCPVCECESEISNAND